LAESQIGLDKTELIRPEEPWCDVEHVALETLNHVDWFNTGIRRAREPSTWEMGQAVELLAIGLDADRDAGVHCHLG
jgi:hypothetical protein